MEITVTLEHGSLTFEMQGSEREALQEEILDIAEFIKENEELFDEFSRRPDGIRQNVVDRSTQEVGVGQTQEGLHQQQDSNCLAEIATKTQTGKTFLSKIIKIPDGEGTPALELYHFDDGTEALGQHRNQRQSQASVLLLYIWDECLDQKKVEYEKLDEALTSSDIEIERRDAMGQAFGDDASDWFESDGTHIWLVGPGKNHARDLLNDLHDEI